MISIAQLKPYPGDDLYNHPWPINLSFVVDEDRLSNFYEIEKILEKKIVSGKL